MSAPNIPIPQTDFINPQTGLIDDVWWRYLRDPTFNSISTATAIPVPSGGTGITGGVSGGLLGFTSATGMSSSALLTQYAIVLGGGAGATPTSLTTTGASTQVLHGNSSVPFYGPVVLTADVSGILPLANGGTNASTAATARDSLGLSSMAQQSSSAVNIVGGAISGVTITSGAQMQVGTSATAGFSVFASSVSWKNNPTHSSSHSFDGAVRVIGNITTTPSPTASGVHLWRTGDVPLINLVSSTSPANARIISIYRQNNILSIGFTDDTFGATNDAIQILGNSSLISSMTFTATTMAWKNPSHNSTHTFLSTVNFQGILNANGSANLGSSATFGLLVNATSVNWNNPQHNSSHTFLSTVAYQGALNANGSVTLGSSATFGMSVNATTVAWASTSVHSGTKIWSSTAQFNNRVQLATDALALQASSLFHGSGAPNNANGLDGDYYFRSDGSVGAYIYFKTSAAWGAIV